MTEDDIQLIRDLAAPLLERYGLLEFALTVRPYRSDMMIDMAVDHVNGGVTLDCCAQFNKDLVAALETRDFHGGNFRVDISSPGMDALLKEVKDFKRVVGKPLDVDFSHNDADTSISGILTDVTDEAITFTLGEEKKTIFLKTIITAKQKV